MAYKIPDLTNAGPKEKRWFNWMTGFSVAAAVFYLSRVGFGLWAGPQIRERKAAVGLDEGMVNALFEFIGQVEITTQVLMFLMTLCCLGFLICTFLWVRALREQTQGMKS